MGNQVVKSAKTLLIHLFHIYFTMLPCWTSSVAGLRSSDVFIRKLNLSGHLKMITSISDAWISTRKIMHTKYEQYPLHIW